jgi:hypothetical protein
MRPRKQPKHDTVYWFTMAWDGYENMDEGEMTESRYTYAHMIESINHYMEKYGKRGVYLECCSMETSISYVDLTEKARSQVNGK